MCDYIKKGEYSWTHARTQVHDLSHRMDYLVMFIFVGSHWKNISQQLEWENSMEHPTTIYITFDVLIGYQFRCHFKSAHTITVVFVVVIGLIATINPTHWILLPKWLIYWTHLYGNVAIPKPTHQFFSIQVLNIWIRQMFTHLRMTLIDVTHW